MAKKYKNSSSTEYTRIYEGMRGMDSSRVPPRSSRGRFAYLENMYVDYENGGDAIESIPGFRKLSGFSKRVHGMFTQRLGDGAEYLVIHSGTKLYRFKCADIDNLTHLTELYASLNDSKSHAVSYGDKLYILDGKSILVLGANGTAKALGNGIVPYVPTISENGEDRDDVNLLTDDCIVKYNIDNVGETGYGSPGLTYEIINEYSKTCKVTGISDSFSGDLYIPSYVFIDGKQYKVTAIGDNAFKGNSKITALYTNTNLEVIEKYAFRGCPSLKTVVFSDTVRELGHYSFYRCTAMTTLYIGIGFTTFGVHAMDECTALRDVYYAGSDDEFIELERVDQLVGAETIHSGVSNNRIILSIPVSRKIGSISRLLVNKEEVEFIFDSDRSEIYFEVLDKTAMSSGEAIAYGKISTENGGKFFTATKDMSVSPSEAITGCTVAAIYDGRLFLSGNPKLPGFVFYSSTDERGAINLRNFSADDFWVDGENYNVCSLLSDGERLIVFKSGDDGYGDIFYHKADGDGGYPVTKVLYNSHVMGEPLGFDGDIVFVSSDGISAIEQASGKPRIRCRSGNINRLLLKEDLATVSLLEWRGYLVVAAGERMYLGDPRASFKKGDSFEYEWYYINGVGTYSGDKRVYRYSPIPNGSYAVHQDIDQPTSLTVSSKKNSDGTYSYYVTDPDTLVKYSVYYTDEYTGGTISPASSMLAIGNLLFFGTQNGTICVFNNDKRGVAPKRISSMADYNESDYKKLYGDIIHPDFYSFHRHATRYVAATVSDDCDLPSFEKKNSRGSLTIKCRNFPRSVVYVDVSTDADQTQRLARLSFSNLCFTDVNFGELNLTHAPYSSVPVQELERSWIEKQITLSSTDFCSPMAIYSIAYRYKIKGNIKKK